MPAYLVRKVTEGRSEYALARIFALFGIESSLYTMGYFFSTGGVWPWQGLQRASTRVASTL